MNPICEPCWRSLKRDGEPLRFKPPKLEVCAFCESPTRSGIYVLDGCYCQVCGELMDPMLPALVALTNGGIALRHVGCMEGKRKPSSKRTARP